jgi:UDP-galactose transporter B1
MFYTNFWAILYIVVSMVLTGEGLGGFAIMLDPANTTLQHYLALFCVCSALGQIFIFLTVKNYGPLVLTTVTTSRKFFTIMASVVFFDHQLTGQQWFAVGLVFIGILLETYYNLAHKDGTHPPAVDTKKPKDKAA